jgi:hypothetical protein
VQSLPIIPILDATPEELCCLDQIIHFAVSTSQSNDRKEEKIKFHGLIQSKGYNS